MTMVANTDHPPQKPSLPARLLRPKVAVSLMLLLLLILSPFLIRGYHLSRIPDVGEPFDIEARYAVVVPDEENAYVEYREAAALYVAPSPQAKEGREAVIEYGWSHATPELEQHLRDNEPALRIWRRGTMKDRAQQYPPKERDISSLPDVSFHRDFAGLVGLFCRKLEAGGKSVEAWDWYRALIRSSRHSGQNGIFIERIVGAAMFSLAVERVEEWSTDRNLTSDQLRQALIDLKHTAVLTEKTSTVIETEYLVLKQMIARCESGSHGYRWSDFDVDDNRFLFYVMAEPEVSNRLLRFHFRNLLLFCDQPRYQRPPRKGDRNLFDDPRGLTVEGGIWEISDVDVAFERSQIAMQCMPVVSAWSDIIDRDIVHIACLSIVLAGQAYHRDHNRFPATLDALVPGYLAEIPVDPFDGLPLKYRLDDEGAVVYSVFTNGVDDGGGEFSFDQAPGSEPRDYGLRLHTPGERPLVAPKPRESN